MKFPSCFDTRLGILLLILVGLLFWVHLAQAQTGYKDLDVLLKGKRVVTAGACAMKDKESFAYKEEEITLHLPCVIGIQLGEEDVIYIGIHDEKGYTLLIRAEKGGKQEVLWRRPLISA